MTKLFVNRNDMGRTMSPASATRTVLAALCQAMAVYVQFSGIALSAVPTARGIPVLPSGRTRSGRTGTATREPWADAHGSRFY